MAATEGAQELAEQVADGEAVQAEARHDERLILRPYHRLEVEHGAAEPERQGDAPGHPHPTHEESWHSRSLVGPPSPDRDGEIMRKGSVLGARASCPHRIQHAGRMPALPATAPSYCGGLAGLCMSIEGEFRLRSAIS